MGQYIKECGDCKFYCNGDQMKMIMIIAAEQVNL